MTSLKELKTIALKMYPLVSTKDLTQSECNKLGLPEMPSGSNSLEWEAWRNSARAELAIRKAKAFLQAFKGMKK